MTNWIAKACAEIYELGDPATAETDECSLLAVSSVSSVCIPGEEQHLSSVLSASGWEEFEKHIVSADLIEAAMKVCEQHCDDATGREEMRRQCIDLPLLLQLDLYEHFTGMAGRGQRPFAGRPSPGAQSQSMPQKGAPARLEISPAAIRVKHHG